MRLGFLHIEVSSPLMYRELAKRMVRSVKAVMPGLEIVQMTDMRTPALPGVDDVVAMSTTGLEFAPFRLKHLSIFDGEAIFLDTDIIVRRDLREAFIESFDIGLTKRDYPIFGKQTGKNLTESMPYNTGVMFSREPKFFHEAFEYSQGLTTEEQQWFGDQLAIAHIARGKYMVKDFNCELWNRVPVRADDLGEAYAVHYKGEKRKAWMLAERDLPAIEYITQYQDFYR